ncbi:MAG TPA: hypothetical protein VFE51_22875 [Verrucomicrobiae bacterium]|nr:hypothetical protein [Verrucomicrobiae bacterium]
MKITIPVTKGRYGPVLTLFVMLAFFLAFIPIYLIVWFKLLVVWSITIACGNEPRHYKWGQIVFTPFNSLTVDPSERHYPR